MNLLKLKQGINKILIQPHIIAERKKSSAMSAGQLYHPIAPGGCFTMTLGCECVPRQLICGFHRKIIFVSFKI